MDTFGTVDRGSLECYKNGIMSDPSGKLEVENVKTVFMRFQREARTLLSTGL